MNNIPLTICSASCNSQDYIENNLKNLQQRYDNFTWVIAESQQDVNVPLKNLDDVRVQIIPGASKEEVHDTILEKGVHTSTARSISSALASYDHAANLHKCIEHINTRYALLLDPDCFIVQDIGRLINIMQQKDLACMGTAYNKTLQKTKNRIGHIPNVTCMLIDTDKIPKSWMSFYPVPIWQSDYSLDTGFQLYQRIDHSQLSLRYNVEVFTQCISDERCGSCDNIGLEKIGRTWNMERHFIEIDNNYEFAALHVHCCAHVKGYISLADRIYDVINNLKTLIHKERIQT